MGVALNKEYINVVFYYFLGERMAVQNHKSIFCSRNHYVYFVIAKDIQNYVFSLNINIFLIAIADSAVSSFKIFKLKMGAGR